MSGINKVIIVGNCGQDPETKALTGGGSVTNISVATSESWKDKNSGEKQRTHRVAPDSLFQPAGGNRCTVPEKGSKVYQ